MIFYDAFKSKPTFTDYIAAVESVISKRRIDLNKNDEINERIIQSNLPFEYKNQSSEKKIGILMVHGLFDSPFTFREIAQILQEKIWCRSILLPGHGTKPEDLLQVNYEDWLNTVEYGVQNFMQEVDELFLMGYSTGAALSIYHALHQPKIKGLILISPCIRIKGLVDKALESYAYLQRFLKKNTWFAREEENDYAKYRSIPFHPVNQVRTLTNMIAALSAKRLACPMLMILSQNDEVISAEDALTFFYQHPHENNQLLLYANPSLANDKPGVETKLSAIPELNIESFSHVALPFSPKNFHYGQKGDFSLASHPNKNYLFGSYNRLEIEMNQFLYRLGLSKQIKQELTYNPDFDYMIEKISNFIA